MWYSGGPIKIKFTVISASSTVVISFLCRCASFQTQISMSIPDVGEAGLWTEQAKQTDYNSTECRGGAVSNLANQ